MMQQDGLRKVFPTATLILIFFSLYVAGCSEEVIPLEDDDKLEDTVVVSCDEYGAPPMETASNVTLPVQCQDGELLTWEQGDVTRYACLNYPDQVDSAAYRWPMIVYLHGSLRDPTSLYSDGEDLFDLRNDFQMSDNKDIHGFIILSPEGRRATPYSGDGPATGEGFHWDEWYRNPDENPDVQAIDHFIDTIVGTGLVDTSRIYVFGWSNGAYMTVLYSTWRSDMVAAMGQYAGADPWTRTPCPVTMTYTRQVPLFLLRNLCDKLVPCSATTEWIDTLQAVNWPFEYHSLTYGGEMTTSDECSTSSLCDGKVGLQEHFRWPDSDALTAMLEFFRDHPLD